VARSFTASTHKVAITAPNPSGYSALTITSWFNIKGTGNASFDGIVVYSNTTGMWWQPPSGKILYEAGGGVSTGTVTIAANSGWHHVTLTWVSNVTFSSYIDGNLDFSTVVNATPLTSTTTLTLGNDTSTEWLNGYLADCAIWNAALNASEIAALQTGFRPSSIRPKSLQGYWPLDGIQTTEPDLSGLANNGTVTGAVYTPGPPVTLLTPRRPFMFLPGIVPTLMPQVCL